MQVQVNLGCFPSISIISEINFLHRKLSAKNLIPHYIAFRSAWVIVLCFFNTFCNSKKKSINNSNNNKNNNYKKNNNKHRGQWSNLGADFIDALDQNHFRKKWEVSSGTLWFEPHFMLSTTTYSSCPYLVNWYYPLKHENVKVQEII